MAWHRLDPLRRVPWLYMVYLRGRTMMDAMTVRAKVKQMINFYQVRSLLITALHLAIRAKSPRPSLPSRSRARVPLALPRACDDDTQSNASFSQLERSDDDPLSSEHALWCLLPPLPSTC